MIWIPFFIANIIIMIICYITNPLVCLFCDKNGELHGFLHLWQTYDNSVNPSDVTELHELPSIFLYDWNKHYIEYVGDITYKEDTNQKRWYTTCINNDWTLKERLQRYICRVYWLTRNCSYGFSFYWFGNSANKYSSIEHQYYRDERHYIKFGYDRSKSIFTRTWWLKVDWYWTKHLHTDAYMGWKISFPFEEENRYGMIAIRIIPIKFSS
jgi:hypothetical protein